MTERYRSLHVQTRGLAAAYVKDVPSAVLPVTPTSSLERFNRMDHDRDTVSVRSFVPAGRTGRTTLITAMEQHLDVASQVPGANG